MVNSLTNAVMTQIVTNRSEKYINFMHMVFSLGSVLAPIIANSVYGIYGLSGVFWGFGGFSLFWAVYSCFVLAGGRKEKSILVADINLKSQIGAMKAVIRTDGMMTLGFIMVLATCWQLPAIYYLSSLLTEITGQSSYGALTLSILFLGMMVSRLLYSKGANRFPQKWVLGIGSFVGSILWLIAMLVSSINAKIALVGVAAFFAANNFPILFSMGCRISPKNMGIALGIETLGYYLALFLFSPIIGFIGEKIGLNYALMILAVPLLLIVPFALKLNKGLTKQNNIWY
jgi:MFS family permease